MSKILTFVGAGTAFEPAQLAAICHAYDKACKTLRVENGSPMLKEALASEIISLASRGQCDPEYLCEALLSRIAHGCWPAADVRTCRSASIRSGDETGVHYAADMMS